MKCPRGNKHCKLIQCFAFNNDTFICGGINKKPTEYKKDNVWICLKGALTNRSIEMTVAEAGFIISAMGAVVGAISPKILRRNKK